MGKVRRLKMSWKRDGDLLGKAENKIKEVETTIMRLVKLLNPSDLALHPLALRTQQCPREMNKIPKVNCYNLH